MIGNSLFELVGNIAYFTKFPSGYLFFLKEPRLPQSHSTAKKK